MIFVDTQNIHYLSLTPAFRNKVVKLITGVNKVDLITEFFGGDWVLGITESKRDIYYQAGLYTIGRTFDIPTKKWIVVNSDIIVTKTLDSAHLRGEAVDVAPFKRGAVPFWPNPADKDPVKADEAKRFWQMIAGVGRMYGMRAGADFTKRDPENPLVKIPAPDWCHFEQSDV